MQPILRIMSRGLIAPVLSAFLLTLAGCQPPPPAVPAGAACETRSFAVIDDFAGARRGSCRVTGRNEVTVLNMREDDRVINPSPWYAFRLEPKSRTTATIVIDYDTWRHRYHPKTSNDGVTWTRLDERFVSLSDSERQVTIRVPLADDPVWIAGQPMVLSDVYAAWTSDVAASTVAELSVLGESKAGRPIFKLESGSDLEELVILVGRQHPPEVSGAFAFMAFNEVVFGDSELARVFRDRYRIVSIPILNPDGVDNGHWRHNLGGTDLNRDWGHFREPETRLVGTLLDELDAAGAELEIFIDFHSTRENVIYTTDTDQQSNTFVRDWLGRVEPGLTDYPVEHAPRPGANPGVAKNYILARYGVVSMTFEVGDEMDRTTTSAAARVFAVEFMEMMLEKAARPLDAVAAN